MKKILAIIFLLSLFLIPNIKVKAVDYEAKIIIKGVSSDVLKEYNYETVEEAFKDAPVKESLNNSSGKGGVVTVTIQLLKDADADETLIVSANKSNVMFDFNGNDLVSSADPVFQAGPMTFINNSSGENCKVIQKDITVLSTVSPNTIFYAPVGTVLFDISANNLTIGDNTNTIINSKAALPSIMNGIFLGKMEIQAPMFGAAVRGGLFSEDPTAFIDTNAYEAVKNDDNLYYIVTYHAAPLDKDGNIIKKYGLLRDAIKATDKGGTVKLLKQGYPDKTVEIEKDDKKILDLAGFQLIGAASPDALVRVDGIALIRNYGELTITDSVDSKSMNIVYDDEYKDEFFSTIDNKGLLNLENVGVYVNYNQPNYKGNIYTMTNDSREGDAIINISSNTRVGGMNLEPEDPATGKYPALNTVGNYNYNNEINIEYIDDSNNKDYIVYKADNVVVDEIMDVFDNNGNYTTKFYSNNDLELLKKNIKVTKNDQDIEFEYDPNTDILTIPNSNFTSSSDTIVIRIQFEVNYIVDNKVINSTMVIAGEDALLIDIPVKEGYSAKWDNDGKRIIKDTDIKALYTANIESPDTGDNIINYILISIVSIVLLLLVPLRLKKIK